uniref:Uncharacterized protein n=1 Tax=Anopheles atroparvus TaxID=41427 RepID=A0A182ISL3_ANOAO
MLEKDVEPLLDGFAAPVMENVFGLERLVDGERDRVVGVRDAQVLAATAGRPGIARTPGAVRVPEAHRHTLNLVRVLVKIDVVFVVVIVYDVAGARTDPVQDVGRAGPRATSILAPDRRRNTLVLIIPPPPPPPPAQGLGVCVSVPAVPVEPIAMPLLPALGLAEIAERLPASRRLQHAQHQIITRRPDLVLLVLLKVVALTN